KSDILGRETLPPRTEERRELMTSLRLRRCRAGRPGLAVDLDLAHADSMRPVRILVPGGGGTRMTRLFVPGCAQAQTGARGRPRGRDDAGEEADAGLAAPGARVPRAVHGRARHLDREHRLAGDPDRSGVPDTGAGGG